MEESSSRYQGHMGGGPPAVGQLDKGGRGGARTDTHQCPPPKGALTCMEETGSSRDHHLGSSNHVLVFREQRDRALGHRRKGSKAKRPLQVMLLFSKK